MTAWIKMGTRNLVKNARRSVITTFAIAMAFATVNLFDGFATYMHTGNQSVAIYAQASGHLTVFKKGFMEKGRTEPEKYLLSAEDVRTIQDICAGLPEVELATPQLYITGLLSNGRVSTIFVAQGIVPSARMTFVSHLEKMAGHSRKKMSDRIQGRPLQDDQDYGIAVSGGLAKLLGLGLDDDAVAMGNTAAGQMNALDAQLVMIFNAGSDQMNDKFMIVPFAFAQSLYDWQGADRIAVLLKDTRQTDAVLAKLSKACTERGLETDIRTWVQMSEWYRKVKSMFDTIFQFLFVIVFIIVVMSVVNTMGMAVMERTREIGTLRAMGLKRGGVLHLFAVESLLLGISGSLFGVFLTFLGWAFVQMVKPTWMPPGLSNRFVIWIEWVPRTLVFSTVFLLVLCLIASLLPARRAARQNIVDALGHV
ncbi:MAG: FtsX-like permease family protein [bacterium]